jgi:hypothetical protein
MKRPEHFTESSTLIPGKSTRIDKVDPDKDAEQILTQVKAALHWSRTIHVNQTIETRLHPWIEAYLKSIQEVMEGRDFGINLNLYQAWKKEDPPNGISFIDFRPWGASRTSTSILLPGQLSTPKLVFFDHPRAPHFPEEAPPNAQYCVAGLPGLLTPNASTSQVEIQAITDHLRIGVHQTGEIPSELDPKNQRILPSGKRIGAVLPLNPASTENAPRPRMADHPQNLFISTLQANKVAAPTEQELEEANKRAQQNRRRRTTPQPENKEDKALTFHQTIPESSKTSLTLIHSLLKEEDQKLLGILLKMDLKKGLSLKKIRQNNNINDPSGLDPQISRINTLIKLLEPEGSIVSIAIKNSPQAHLLIKTRKTSTKNIALHEHESIKFEEPLNEKTRTFLEAILRRIEQPASRSLFIEIAKKGFEQSTSQTELTEKLSISQRALRSRVTNLKNDLKYSAFCSVNLDTEKTAAGTTYKLESTLF